MNETALQRVLQMNVLGDSIVSDKKQWDSGIRFMEQMLKDKLKQS